MKTIKNAIYGLLILTAIVLTGCTEPGGPFVPNLTALNAAITNANAAKAGVEISVNGSDVSPLKEWVTQFTIDAFELAITAAETAKSQASTQEQVNNAVTILDAATTVFKSAKQNGTKAADADDLNELIGIAQTLMTGVQISVDGSNVSTYTDWVTQSVWNAFVSAIENAAGGNVTEAFNALLTAKNVFEEAMRKGTQLPTEFTVNNSAQWNTAVTAIKNDSYTSYVINISGSFQLNGSSDFTFDNRSGITVAINGNHTISLNGSTKGNLLRINNDQTVIMNGIILKGHLTNDVPLVLLHGNLTMRGSSEIWNNKGDSGGGIRVEGSGVFILESGRIHHNVAQNIGGGVQLNNGAEFIMKGGEISYNTVTEWSGGGVHVNNQSKFTMEGGEISYNTAKYGAGVSIGGESEFIMSGNAIIRNNTATEDSGGGVNVHGNGKFTMGGGEISDNTANNGAGVSIGGESEFTMSGNAKIRNNTATGGWGGGGVRVNQSKFTMSGGEISDNTANNGAGVHVSDESEFIMSGNAIINNNTVTESGGGVFVHQSKFTMGGGVLSYNTARAGAGVLLVDESEFTMRGNAIIRNNTATEHTGGGVHVRQSSFTMEGNAIIRNNTAVQQEGGGVIILQSNFTMAGGEISDNTAGGGGGVKISEESEFIMRGNAIIRNNTALWAGGGVNVHHQSKFTMEGGEISDNTAKWGAGVEIGGESEFTMSGNAKIHNNIATEGEGGGVLVDQSKFTMTSGEISHNTANVAGGVRIGNESEFIMSGNAKIHNNTATEGAGEGGGVLVRHSKFTMAGGEISDNTAKLGGGVNIREEGEFVMSGNAKINNNTATEHDGGGVQVYRGKFTMEGGEISKNTANNGAGVGINGLECEFIMEGGVIYGNNASEDLRNTAEYGAALRVGSDASAKYLSDSGLVDIPLDDGDNRNSTIRVTNGVLTDN